MSLAKWAAKYAPQVLKGLKDNKALLYGIGGGGAAIGAGIAAQPMVDDFMTDQAINSMIRTGKRGLVDAMDFAEEHPYLTSAVLGGAALTGAGLGEAGVGGLLDRFAPAPVAAAAGMARRRKRHQ